MKRFCLLAGLIAVIGFTLGVSTESRAAGNEEMLKGAAALDNAFIAAFNKGDTAALAALYWNSPDVVMFPPGEMVQKGIGAIKKGMADMFATMPGCKLTFTESHLIPAGDMVIGWGLWSMTMTGPDGAPMTMAGRYTDVKAKRDGKWVYILDHASTPMMEDHDHDMDEDADEDAD